MTLKKGDVLVLQGDIARGYVEGTSEADRYEVQVAESYVYTDGAFISVVLKKLDAAPA